MKALEILGIRICIKNSQFCVKNTFFMRNKRIHLLSLIFRPFIRVLSAAQHITLALFSGEMSFKFLLPATEPFLSQNFLQKNCLSLDNYSRHSIRDNKLHFCVDESREQAAFRAVKRTAISLVWPEIFNFEKKRTFWRSHVKL
jgi:hypothetical protein